MFRMFEGDPAGGDELIVIRDHEGQIIVIVSGGFDYGSDLTVYRIREDQVQSLAACPSSYDAKLFLKERAEPINLARGNQCIP